jgi:hypothetical protein
VQRLRPEIWRQRNWLLYHDNAPFHTSFFARQFLTKNMTINPTYPAFLFPLLKMKQKGHHFERIEVIEAESQAVLNTLKEPYFQDAFKNVRSPGNGAKRGMGLLRW